MENDLKNDIPNWMQRFDKIFPDAAAMDGPNGRVIVEVPKYVPALRKFISQELEKAREGNLELYQAGKQKGYEEGRQEAQTFIDLTARELKRDVIVQEERLRILGIIEEMRIGNDKGDFVSLEALKDKIND